MAAGAVLAPLAEQHLVDLCGHGFGVPGHVDETGGLAVHGPEVGQVHVSADGAPVAWARTTGPGAGRFIDTGVLGDVPYVGGSVDLDRAGPRAGGQVFG